MEAVGRKITLRLSICEAALLLKSLEITQAALDQQGYVVVPEDAADRDIQQISDALEELVLEQQLGVS